MPQSSLRLQEDSVTKTQGSFEVPFQSFQLSNFKTNADIVIENNSSQPASFTIKPTSHNLTQDLDKPLSWLKYALCKTYTNDKRTDCKTFEAAASATNGNFAIQSVPSKTRIIVRVSNAADKPSEVDGYKGQLQVVSGQLGTQDISLSYVKTVAGQWQGKMIFFGNFDATNISKFPSASLLPLTEKKNALMRRWDEFKHQSNGLVSYEQSVRYLRAMLTSLETGSWGFSQTQKDCKDKLAAGSDDVVCFPSEATKGYSLMTLSKKEAPVPSGVLQMSFTVNIKEDKNGSNALIGRVDSRQTLHYPGNPTVSLAFNDAPGSKQISPLKSFEAIAYLGGRYDVTDKENCHDTDTFAKTLIPWLPGDFVSSAFNDNGSLVRYECRASTFPQKPTGSTEEQDKIKQANRDLSQANPIANGWTIKRKLELVDGALISNRFLFIIFRERVTSFFANSQSQTLSQDFTTYGYMMLERTGATLQDSDYQGVTAPTPSNKTCTQSSDCESKEECVGNICQEQSKLKLVQCDADLVKEAIGGTETDPNKLTVLDKVKLVDALMNGPNATSTTAMQVKSSTGSQRYVYSNKFARYIHYFCEDTGLFNSGKNANTQCPEGSKVIFFDSKFSETQIKALPCQSTKDCHKTLDGWKTDSSQPLFRMDLNYICEQSGTTSCDTDRLNLRKGKVFFQRPTSASNYVTTLPPMETALADAFRYKVKFRSRDGKSIGFVPAQCAPYSTQVTPYCYNPAEVEKIAKRLNCLQFVANDKGLFRDIGATMRSKLYGFLRTNFSFFPSNSTTPLFGFEYMNAELKVMLADEAYIQALTSRFDLAGTQAIAFDGTKFEAGGLKLSGMLGVSMHSLYKSVQYYQMVVDRFFSQSPSFALAFESGSSFVDVNVATTYFNKVLQAASRKARAWSKIAMEYHQLNRSDLAKKVVERAYATTYMEFTIFTRLMTLLLKSVDFAERDQIQKEIETATLIFKAAMSDMENTYKEVNKSLSFYGVPQGYVPIPALDLFSASTQGNNIVKDSIDFAKQKKDAAKEKEEKAIQSRRTFDTDNATFQSELINIENNYENQLVDICGTIKDSSGKTYPAISKYAHLDPIAKQYGDPCGRMGSGTLYQSILQLEKFKTRMQAVQTSYNNKVSEIEVERKRINTVCRKVYELAGITREYLSSKFTLEQEILASQRVIDTATRVVQNAATAFQLWKCGGLECPSGYTALGFFALTTAAQETTIQLAQDSIASSRAEINAKEVEYQQRQMTIDCDQDGRLRVESEAAIIKMSNELSVIALEAKQAEYDVYIALAQIKALQDRAARTLAQQEQITQQAIDVQAARNDPNVRIYQNDTIIAAERNFNGAMRAAYEATLVYEYYTGTTYKDKHKIYLIRMVQYGDVTLEGYLSDLETAFRDFESTNGKPDLRVMILSLRDDILRIPRTAADGRALNDIERSQLLQKALIDPKNINSEGIIHFPFSISVNKSEGRVSSRTINHKITYVEADLGGTQVGDRIGRINLVQKGTGVVRVAKDNLTYYTLPQRTAIINLFFNGVKDLDDKTVYKNYRLRDRPLGNTHWEIQFDLLNEKDNQDIDLTSVSDLQIYIYYTDFTEE